ncbi:MAG: hypothetical protein M3R25_14485, partial [Bacteroidota bacterium]|nr:hypothetical protein [Bacteroidota bacterium]
MITNTKRSSTQEPLPSYDVHGVLFYALGLAFIIITAICIFTPSLLFFKTIASNTLYIMLA